MMRKDNAQIRFRFVLRPVEELSDDWRATWFFLTDGWYWIEVGEVELFRYSDQFVAAQKTPDGLSVLPYPAYPVARFWEDLLQLVRQALVPIPSDIAARLTDLEAWKAYLKSIGCLLSSYLEATSERFDRADKAYWWWGSHRQLSFGHLYLPRIFLWRVADTMYLHWDDACADQESVSEFAASPKGTVTFSVDALVDAVTEFNDALFSEMKRRTDSDETLERQQASRAASLEGHLNNPDDEDGEDWEGIRSALEWFDSNDAFDAVG
jgi:hypothetical protein